MSAAILSPAMRWRWPASVVVVLALHGLALLVLREIHPIEAPLIPQEAVLLDLAPAAPAAPAPTPEPAPPPVAAPQPPAPQPPPPPETPPPEPPPPEPTPVVPAPPPPPPPAVVPDKPEVVLPPPPPPRAVPVPPRHVPVVKPRPPHPVAVAPPPAQSAVTAPPTPAAPPAAAAPAQSQSAPGPEAATWASRLAAHLLRFRHYPPEAERRGFIGVVMMRFSVDGSGRVVSSSIVRGSGHDMLDQEAVEWLQRAQPLPAPPPDKAAPAQIVVPLSFILR